MVLVIVGPFGDGLKSANSTLTVHLDGHPKAHRRSGRNFHHLRGRYLGDSYDNALAESVIGLFETEVIKRLGPWKTMQNDEWETMRWVDWYNEHRLLSSIGYMPPAEAERRHFERVEPTSDVA